VTIVKGELEDATALDAALAGGVSAVLSALGPSFRNPPGTPIANGYRAVLAAMRRAGVRRLIALGNAKHPGRHDKSSIVYAAMVAAVAFGARSAYKDIVAVGEVIRASSEQDVEWTIARVPVLRTMRIGTCSWGILEMAGPGLGIRSRGLALPSLWCRNWKKGEWIQRAPLITSA